MGSSGKKKTTMAKLAREGRLRQRRMDKEARKVARKLAPIDPPTSDEDDLVAEPQPEDPASE